MRILTYSAYYRRKSFQPDEAFAVRVVAVIGPAHDWAAYRGNTDWSDEDIARQGDKLREEAAMALFPTIAAQYNYRD